jgi:hypothetical protein
MASADMSDHFREALSLLTSSASSPTNNPQKELCSFMKYLHNTNKAYVAPAFSLFALLCLGTLTAPGQAVPTKAKGKPTTKATVRPTAKKAPAKKPTPTKKPVPTGPLTADNDPQLKNLRSRLFQAEIDTARLRNEVDRYTIFTVIGKYESGDAQGIMVYGTAMSSGPSPFGQTMEKRFIAVIEPYPEDLRSGMLTGLYVFRGSQRGTNVYGRPPEAYWKARNSLSARLEQKEFLEQAIQVRLATLREAEAGREAEKDAALELAQIAKARQEQAKAASTEEQRKARVAAEVRELLASHEDSKWHEVDAETRASWSAQSMALYNRLTPKDEFPQLREDSTVQLTLAAVVQAREGNLDGSALTAAKAFWSDAEASAVSAIYTRQKLGATAHAALTRKPAALNLLLEHWADNLAEYVRTSEYADGVKARKFAEVLLRVSTGVPGVDPGAERNVLERAWKETGLQGTEQKTTSIRIPQAPVSTEGGTVPAETEAVAEVAPVPALNFFFTRFSDGKKLQLKDFRGKVVLVYYWDVREEDRIVEPMPTERLKAIAGEYDPEKVVLLAVHESTHFGALDYEVKRRTSAWEDRHGEPAKRTFPDKIYYLEERMYGIGSSPLLQEFHKFYAKTRGRTLWSWREKGEGPQVTVINARGDVVGSVDFLFNEVLTAQANEGKRVTQDVYDFDKDALDALIIQALGTKKPETTEGVEDM